MAQAVKNTKNETKAGKSTKSTARNNNQKDNTLLRKLFIDSIKDIYWAEKHLMKTLPKMMKAATTPELAAAIEDHLAVTETQVTRLEEVFAELGETARGKKCEAMEGLAKEGQSIIEDTEEDTFTRDVGIIMASQKVEHYEIASYGSLVQLARILGEESVATVFEEILAEEKEADDLLTQIATNGINENASEE